ncbi:MAG: hypothetical protein SGPRY_008086 [Prymnesium sp.]
MEADSDLRALADEMGLLDEALSVCSLWENRQDVCLNNAEWLTGLDNVAETEGAAAGAGEVAAAGLGAGVGVFEGGCAVAEGKGMTVVEARGLEVEEGEREVEEGGREADE